MKDDDQHLSHGERRAIDAIGQQLDREFGGTSADASRDPSGPASVEEPTRARHWLRTALAIGAGTVALVALVAVTAVVATKLLSPGSDAPSRDRSSSSTAELRRGSGAAPVRTEPIAGGGRIASAQIERQSPCPPVTRVAAAPPAQSTSRKRVDQPVVAARARPAASRESRPSGIMAMSMPAYEPRRVEAP
jgi:hypothetical protein